MKNTCSSKLKKTVKICVIPIFAVAVCLLFSACSNGRKYGGMFSEKRESIYFGEYNGSVVYAYGGQREKNYQVDGKANGMQDFFTVFVESEIAPSVKLQINGKTVEGQMQANPIKNNYYFEAEEKTVEERIVCVINGEEITLEKVKTQIGAYEAFGCALTALSSELKKADEGRFNGEIYLRLMQSPTGEDPYWFVGFVLNDQKCATVLIDSVSGKILATKKIQ